LAGGVGILDPCEKDIVDAADNLMPQQREDLTLAAQVTCLLCFQGLSCKFPMPKIIKIGRE